MVTLALSQSHLLNAHTLQHPGLREKQALGRPSRRAEQLASMGKLRDSRKLRSSVPAAFKDAVPDDHPFTCVTIFESILRGEIKPLYSMDGKPQIPQFPMP